MKRKNFFLICAAMLCVPIWAQAQMISSSELTGEPMSTLVNINKLAMWVRADGISAQNPYAPNSPNAIPWGVLYPRGLPVGLVWVDDLVWGGFVQDGQQPALRVGGSSWRISGMAPGSILSPGLAEDPNDPHVNRVWRYRTDWQTVDLNAEALDILFSRPEAAASNFKFSPEQLKAVADSLRLAYQKDLQEWPWQKGAPFIDRNRNGMMDADETPGLLDAQQVAWFVANDLNPILTQQLYGSSPIGIEIQTTLWAYNDDANLANTIFRRMRWIYKGTSTTPANARIDSMGLAFYSEADVGNFADDFGGTDTTLQMVYAYNSTTPDPDYQKYSPSPPAIGYMLLQGPIVLSTNTNDRARFNFSERRGYRNLPMTGSWVDVSGDENSQPTMGQYAGTLQYYNVINGFRPRPADMPTPFIDPSGKPTRFSRTGDPVTNTGWIDMYPGNRQLTLTTSNFKMAIGDTQEVILATTAGLGADHLASVTVMKFYARYAREFALSKFVTGVDARATTRQNASINFHLYPSYPNPLRASALVPGATIRYQLLLPGHVTLVVFNMIGQEVARLVEQAQPAGEYAVQWDGTDLFGKKMPSGIYFCHFAAGGIRETRKIVLVR